MHSHDAPPPRLTHLDDEGRVRMVDVGGKAVTRRTAVAEGSIAMSRQAWEAMRDGAVPKGDVAAVVRIAAITGTKRTADLVPLCHPIAIDAVRVEVEQQEGPPPVVRVEVEVSTSGRTGVEMEALCGVSAGLLAVYDMCKGLDRAMEIGNVRLVAKHGGRSGTWQRADAESSPGRMDIEAGDR